MARPTRRRRRILLTGASGHWGRATLRELRRRDTVDVVAFARPTPADRALLREFDDWPALTVTWGDLTVYDDVLRAVQDIDTVLHVAAVVPPYADTHPRLAHRVNVGSMQNLVRAAKALGPRTVEVVGVGSVAETGDRPPPHHWGRVGDPVRVSDFDEYGLTKVTAERILVDSGLPRWAWLRQTGMLHPGVLTVRDPIITHVPLAGVLEWVSDEDSARLLAGIAQGAPHEFWCTIHDVGGGDGWRLTNWAFFEAVGTALGARDVRAWYERHWFALRGFHGQWFTDSDDLERLVPFRGDTFGQALARALAATPAWVRATATAPGCLVKHLVMRPLAYRPRGTMHAARHRAHDEGAARFGSPQAWRRIGTWSTFTAPAPSRTPTLLDHGFDETVPASRWTAAHYREAARFRGGHLLTGDVARGDATTPLTWRCAFEHVFAASARLVLHGGHWCPVCVRDRDQYAAQAEHNAFLAQVES